MPKFRKITTKVLLLFLLAIFLSASYIAIAQDTPITPDDSMYKYNALENKVNFLNYINNTNNADNNDTLNELNALNEKLLENIIFVNSSTEKLEDIIKQQIISIQKSEEAMTTIENTSTFQTFIIGNRLGILKFQLVQMEYQISVLEMLALETIDNVITININAQIKILEKEREKVENFIQEHDSKFSLFGWLRASL